MRIPMLSLPLPARNPSTDGKAAANRRLNSAAVVTATDADLDRSADKDVTLPFAAKPSNGPTTPWRLRLIEKVPIY